jgi:hypothetical protein
VEESTSAIDVLVVRAQDGDRGIDNRITFSIEGGFVDRK